MRQRVQECLARIWLAVVGVSVRAKIMGIVLGLVLLLGLGVTIQVRMSMSDALSLEMEQWAIAVTRDLAARSTDLILTNDLFGLHELVRDTVRNNDDLRYAFVLDADGRVLAHSFSRGVPPDLLTVNAVRPDERYRGRMLDTEEGLIHDMAVPIFGGRAGTARVGVSELRVQAQMVSTTRQLLLTTLIVSLVGIAGGYVLTWVLTRPVNALVRVTRAVAAGDLSQQAPQWSGDEIGVLGASFNAMLADLRRAREESEAYNRRLLHRNRELSALNAVAQVVSGPLSLQQAMEQALEQVLNVMEADVGWICLLAGDGSCKVFAVRGSLDRGLLESHSAGCNCRDSLETGRPTVIRHLAEDCRLSGATCGSGCLILGHVSIPLSAKGKIVGLLNVVCHTETRFSEDEVNLLGAIGRQLGVAIENARLWEELQRKEALRGKLLEKIISAQEDERRRIARELHDETGQSLTSLLVGLTVLETSSDLAQIQDGVRDLKTVVASTLTSVHGLAAELRPSVLDDLGLVPALQRYVRDYSARFHVAVDFQTVGLDGGRFAPEAELTIYRIVQEAMLNAARHAKANEVSVLLERRANALVAIVEDDGRGFDVDGVLNTEVRHRLGLYGMEERATLVGGHLTIESSPGTGTAVFVEVPL